MENWPGFSSIHLRKKKKFSQQHDASCHVKFSHWNLWSSSIRLFWADPLFDVDCLWVRCDEMGNSSRHMNTSSMHFMDGCACSQDVIVKRYSFLRFGKQAMQGSICPSSPLCVALPQIFFPVRWPCFNVSWKGHSGPVHWIRKALLGLYAWLRSSVIPLDTRDVPCLHHWQVFSNTHTHTHTS